MNSSPGAGKVMLYQLLTGVGFEKLVTIFIKQGLDGADTALKSTGSRLRLLPKAPWHISTCSAPKIVKGFTPTGGPSCCLIFSVAD